MILEIGFQFLANKQWAEIRLGKNAALFAQVHMITAAQTSLNVLNMATVRSLVAHKD